MASAGMKSVITYTHRASPIIAAISIITHFPFFFKTREIVIICLHNDFAYLALYVYSFEIMRVGGDGPQLGSTSSTRFLVGLFNLKRKVMHLC